MNLFKAVCLNQLDDAAKTGLHVGRAARRVHLELDRRAVLRPKPFLYIIAFLQCCLGVNFPSGKVHVA